MEYLWLDTDSHTQFSIIRLMYFVGIGHYRAVGTYTRPNTDLDSNDDVFISKEYIKTFKVWLVDIASWFLVIWMFGRSIM